mmetsp:Transcript_87390/g.222615  ORF Transcript_87390/g.222615 Transcript_87390/m.222615 type:complete len:240 (+) Transcript_87390:526-1245(+)
MPQDGVLGAAVEDARLVVEPAVAVHGHDHRALLDHRLHQRLGAVARQLVPAADAHAGAGLPEASGLMALAGPGCVLEVALQRDAVVAHPGVGELASGAIAAALASAVLRVRDAVHERLRGDAGRGARVLDELCLQGLGGGDGPAAAAIALIPHVRAAVDVHAAGGAGHGLVARGVQAVHDLGAAAQERGASAAGAAARGLVAVEGGSLGLVPIHKGVHACLPKAALLGVPGIRGPDLRE